MTPTCTPCEVYDSSKSLSTFLPSPLTPTSRPHEYEREGAVQMASSPQWQSTATTLKRTRLSPVSAGLTMLPGHTVQADLWCLSSLAEDISCGVCPLWPRTSLVASVLSGRAYLWGSLHTKHLCEGCIQGLHFSASIPWWDSVISLNPGSS